MYKEERETDGDVDPADDTDVDKVEEEKVELLSFKED